MRKQGAKWSFPEPLIKTAWHPGLHRLITKGWNLFFYIWRKHCLHNTEGFTAPSSNLGLQHTAIRQNMVGQPVPWTSAGDGYSLLAHGGNPPPRSPQFQIKILVPGNWWMDLFFTEASVAVTERWSELSTAPSTPRRTLCYTIHTKCIRISIAVTHQKSK